MGLRGATENALASILRRIPYVIGVGYVSIRKEEHQEPLRAGMLELGWHNESIRPFMLGGLALFFYSGG